jgi:hypothetical protein
MSNLKAWYVTGNTDCYEVFLGSNRIAICDLKEDADLILELLNTKRNGQRKGQHHEARN